MPIFEYEAVNESGEAVKGTLMSSSLTNAAADLEKRGFKVEHVSMAQNVGDPIPADFEARREGVPAGYNPPPTDPRPVLMTTVVGPLFLKVQLSTLQFFFRQLSAMMAAGVPIVGALDTLANQTYSPVMKQVVTELAGHAREGRPLTVGMQRYPEVFTPLMVSLTRAGEEGGMLDAALTQIADYIEREIKLRNNIRRATIYPKLVLFCSVVIILGANFIIGMVGGKTLIETPLTNPATWVILTPIIVLLFLFVKLGMPNPRVKFNFDAVMLMLPAIGTTMHEFAMAKFGRSLGALYRGGVPIGKAIRLSADACGSENIRAKIYPSAKAIEEGGSITENFAKTDAFNGTVLAMMGTGETTGRLDEMVEKVADFYEEDAMVRANQMAAILGVVCLVVVGVYVGYVVISYFMGYASQVQDASG